LLEDVREVFRRSGQSTLFNAELIGHLAAVPGGPWSTLTARRLSALLAAHDIVPGPVRRGEAVRRGYHRRRFELTLQANEDTELADTSAATNGAASGLAGQRSGPPAQTGQNDRIKAPPDPSSDPAAEAWRQRFLEHMARIMRNPARTEREAAIIAFEAVAEIWIRSSPQNNFEHCARCSRPGGLIAIKPLDGQAGATWLHGACFAGWHAPRKAQAVEGLARYGITRDGLTGRRETPDGASAAATEEND
jgi:hypothetical protein